MSNSFPFGDLPQLVQNRILDLLDGKTLRAMRTVSRATYSLSNSNYLNQRRMQVHITNAEDIKDLLTSRLSSSFPLIVPTSWSSFRIVPNWKMTTKEGRQKLPGRLIRSIIGTNVHALELSGMKINYSMLDDLILHLPNLCVLKSRNYISGELAECNNGMLRKLQELTIQANPGLGGLILRTPNLRRLNLVTECWESYWSSPTEFSSSLTTTLLSYIKNIFYPKSRWNVGLGFGLTIDFSEHSVPFTTLQLLSICALCNPIGVKLESILASSLPGADTNSPLSPQVLNSFNCISSIYVGNSDKCKIFPSRHQLGQGHENGIDQMTIHYNLIVRERTELSEISIPAHDLTHINFQIDYHLWRLHHYDATELSHVLGEIFVPRPHLVALEISRLVLDLNGLLDKAMDFSLFPNLRTLTIKRFGENPSQFANLCDALPELERLTVSHIRDEHLIGEGGVSPPIFKLTKLRHLRVSRSHLTQRSMKVLGQMTLESLILEDSNNCALHMMTMEMVGVLLAEGGVLANYISWLELPKPTDLTDSIIFRDRCPFLHTLKFSPTDHNNEYDQVHEDVICRLVREAGPIVW